MSQSPDACVLAIGAHPDDAVLSAGGVLAGLSAAGHRVVLLTLSSGELGGDGPAREAEENEAARRLGATAEFARLPDGAIPLRAAIDAIDAAIGRHAPAVAFVHTARDTHQDHVIAAQAAAVACRQVATLLSYESPSSVGFQPAAAIDVSLAWERKLHALAAYESQVPRRKLLAWTEAVARFRAWPRHVGAVCEAFELCHSAFLPLVPAQPLGGAAYAGLGMDRAYAR